jgi:hypothetical protein
VTLYEKNEDKSLNIKSSLIEPILTEDSLLKSIGKLIKKNYLKELRRKLDNQQLNEYLKSINNQFLENSEIFKLEINQEAKFEVLLKNLERVLKKWITKSNELLNAIFK